MTDARTETLRRVTFALLVAATFSAFFVTQRLKHGANAIVTFHAERFFSPFSHTHPVERISLRLKRTDTVTITVINPRGDDVRTLVRDRRVTAFHRVKAIWNGYTDSGRLAPDATYRIRIRLRDQGRTVVVPRSFLLHTAPPRPLITQIRGPAGVASAGPAILPQASALTISFSLGGGRAPELIVYRTDVKPAQLVTTLPVAAGATTATWDGRVRGRRVPPGTYLVAIRDTDVEGNAGSTPATLPPVTTGTVPGRPGVTVRYLGVQPPADVVAQDAPLVFGIDARRSGYSWTVTRVGAARPRKAGSSSRPLLRMRPPAGTSGVYVLGVRSANHSTQVPFAVQGPGRQRVLVVLPMITWLGRSAVDDDGDGLANTLEAGDSVRFPRVFAADGLPAGFAAGVAPVLGYLDHLHLRYDLATDLGLSRHQGVTMAAHSGVLLIGDERWVPTNVQAQLRAFGRRGGRIASLGVDSLLRAVRLSGDQLSSPAPPAVADTFGARLDPLASNPGPVTNFLDQVGLFTGGGGQFAGYSTYQSVASVGPTSQLVASGVTGAGRPAITAVRYGRGLVIRVGLPEFGSRLASDPTSGALMARIWVLLAQ